MDRLTRSVPFLNRLLEAGVDVRFADLPRIEGATGRFLLQMMVSVAELEAGMISRRTKDALAQAKKRGVILVVTAASCRQQRCARSPRRPCGSALMHALQIVAPAIRILQVAGAASLRAIANGLNAQNIPTARGNGKWSATQVARVLERI
jgi:DNA invertase Pin-like site-specific DNA recombinase